MLGWSTIGNQDLESMSGKIKVFWITEIYKIFRFRLLPKHSTENPIASPSIVLEAAILPKGLTYASIPTPSKMKMNKSSSSAIKLLEIHAEWYTPLPTLFLHTRPGINYISPNITAVVDFVVRWSMAWIDQEGRKGSTISSAEEWTKYLDEPVLTYPDTSVPYNLVVIRSTNPLMVEPKSGNLKHTVPKTDVGQDSPTNSFIVKRKGQKMVLQHGGLRKSKVLPKPTAKPKYSSDPHPLFKLDSSALPPGTPQSMIDSASGHFAASVSVSTLSTYKTALVHLEKLESILGKKFASPPTEEEMILFSSYLANRNIAKSTILSYTSGLRYITLARGAAHHTKMPELGAQIITGASNLKKDARAEAAKPKRRPVTLLMLKLLQHAISSHKVWTDFEKSLRWSCMLLAYWGSFRMGELLQTEKSKFHPDSSLIPTDIKFQEDSVAIWIRSPKVWRLGGDVIEVWAVKENQQLDPILALKHFLQLRSNSLGPAEDCPVFLHEDGSLYTKAELNKDIKELLSCYPSISSPLDLWSGHSFRAGLATLLSSLGFSKEQIQKWGRWSSMAFQAYNQDQTKRREVRRELTKVYSQMLATI